MFLSSNGEIQRFQLGEQFLSNYKKQPPSWGYGALSYITYKRTYSRPKADGSLEEWWETCRRVVEGTFTVQKTHCAQLCLPWNAHKAVRSAQEMYKRMFAFKFLPPGRGLWAMGTDFALKRSGACLNNCAFTSTRDLRDHFSQPFTWMFEMSMLGVGVGFDTRGAGTVTIKNPVVNEGWIVEIEDSREGWRDAAKVILEAFGGTGELPYYFSYDKIRPKGAPIKSFGGVASGPEPLKELLDTLITYCTGYRQRQVDEAFIVDVMNMIGKCVVSGGVRRTAQLSLGASEAFMMLKQDEEKLAQWRWASNNSILAEVGMDYSYPASLTAQNGEPGYFWLENCQAYGRMEDPPNWKDAAALGTNPCSEQTLFNWETCCLVESFPANHDSLHDYLLTLKYAYLYAKTVTLVPTHSPATNQVMLRNRRIGCSMSGIMQAIEKLGYRNFFKWCNEGYQRIQQLDKSYSDWLCIPLSIKTTSVKPSGTVSLLSGATPGMHGPHAEYYIRRVRIRDTSPLIPLCQDAGYKVEKAFYAPNTMVIEFPIHTKLFRKKKSDMSLREQFDLNSQLQRWWSDNQVSCTATFSPDEAKEIPELLEAYEDRLKSISLLPLVEADSKYKQLPYETITATQYADLVAKIKPLRTSSSLEHEVEDKFCDGETCMI